MPQAHPSGRPSIAVVMANHNGALYIRQAVASVLAQSQRDLELVIVDDGSTDSSAALIAEQARHEPRIRALYRPVAGGAAVARNDAIETISSDWLAVCDSDDVMHPERLQRLLSVAEDNGADMVSDDSVHFSSDPMQAPRTVMGFNAPLPEGEVLLSELARRSEIGYLKPIMRRDRLGARPYDETLVIGEDLQLYLELVCAGAKLRLVDAGLYLYRRHAASLSHRSNPDQITQRRKRLQSIHVPRGADARLAREALDALCNKMSQTEAKERFVQLIRQRRPRAMLAQFARHPIPVLDWTTGLVAQRLRRLAPEATQASPSIDISQLASPLSDPDQRRKTAELCYWASLGRGLLAPSPQQAREAAWVIAAIQHP